MIFTLIVGFGIGLMFDKADPLLRSLVGKIGISLDADDFRLVCFAFCLGAGALALTVLGVRAYPVALCLGAILAIARKPLLARLTQRR